MRPSRARSRAWRPSAPRSTARKLRHTQTRLQTAELVRDTVRVLREAGEPLPRREVAARLGVKPWVAGYRLDKAVELRFAEKLGGNVETVFAMIKAKFGGSVLSRNPVAQINEVLAKCVAHNLCCVVKAIFTADLAPTFWSDAPLALVQS